MIPRGWSYFWIHWRLKESWKNINLICPSFAIAWQWYYVLKMNGFHFTRTPMQKDVVFFVCSSTLVLVLVLKIKGIHFSRATLKLNDSASPSCVGDAMCILQEPLGFCRCHSSNCTIIRQQNLIYSFIHLTQFSVPLTWYLLLNYYVENRKCYYQENNQNSSIWK